MHGGRGLLLCNKNHRAVITETYGIVPVITARYFYIPVPRPPCIALTCGRSPSLCMLNTYFIVCYPAFNSTTRGAIATKSPLSQRGDLEGNVSIFLLFLAVIRPFSAF